MYHTISTKESGNRPAREFVKYLYDVFEELRLRPAEELWVARVVGIQARPKSRAARRLGVGLANDAARGCVVVLGGAAPIPGAPQKREKA
jgi:hypothetical protein